MFKDRLKELRAKYNYTQGDMAEMFNVSLGAVGNWETGKRVPDTEMLVRIADRFNVTVDYLIGREVKQEDNDELSEYLEQLKRFKNAPRIENAVFNHKGRDKRRNRESCKNY